MPAVILACKNKPPEGDNGSAAKAHGKQPDKASGSSREGRDGKSRVKGSVSFSQLISKKLTRKDLSKSKLIKIFPGSKNKISSEKREKKEAVQRKDDKNKNQKQASLLLQELKIAGMTGHGRHNVEESELEAEKDESKDKTSVKGKKVAVSPKVVIIDLRRKIAAGKVDHGPPMLEFKEILEEKIKPQERGLVFVHKSSGLTEEVGREVQSSSASQRLLKAFQEKMIHEVVRKTTIILKDGGNGEIRLVLKPESLGSVRIRINIIDNSVEGRIIVENNSVKELFKSSMEQLQSALKEEGFQSARLEVSVGGRENQDRADVEDMLGWTTASESAKAEASLEFDRAVPVLTEIDELLLVNLVV